MGGLRYESLSDMPARMRQLAADKIVAGRTVVVSQKT